MDEILLRIKVILEKEGISPSELADKIGIGRPLLSHIFSGRNKPSLQVVLKILETYPAYSADWLLKGKENVANKEEPIAMADMKGESNITVADNSQGETNYVKNSANNEEGLPDVILMMFDDKTFEAYKLRK